MSRRGNGEGTSPRQRKDGRWVVQLRYTTEDGVAKRTEIYGRTAKDVREKAKTVQRRLEQKQPAKDRKVTLADFTRTWATSTLLASDLKASTRANYATIAQKHIVEAPLGRMTLDKVRPTFVESWLVNRRELGLADSTVRSAYTILRAVLETAVRDGALARNPAAMVKRPTVTAKEAAYLTPAQVRDLLATAGGTRYRPLFNLLVNTGLRRGEALALHWRDVDFTKRTIRVRGTLARVDGQLVVTEPKTAKSKRVLHMSPTAATVLQEVRSGQRQEQLRAGSVWAATGYVFTTETGTPCDPRNALRALKAAARTAGLPDVGLHTLRHSAASVMLENGIPLKVVSELLGHSSVAITGDVYGHVSPNVSADALDALAGALA